MGWERWDVPAVRVKVTDADIEERPTIEEVCSIIPSAVYLWAHSWI
jgi:hypothetical protein